MSTHSLSRSDDRKIRSSVKLFLREGLGGCYFEINFMRFAPRHPLLTTIAVAVFSLSTALLSPMAKANLVTNGGFEDGATPRNPGLVGGGTASGGGDTTLIDGNLNGWQVGPSSVNVPNPNVLATNQNSYYATATNGDTTTPVSGPHGGDLAAVFPKFPQYDGYISQALNTGDGGNGHVGVFAGYIYKISFWLANQVGDNANNYMNVNFGGDIATPGGPITGGNTLTGGTPALPGAIPVPTDWTYYEFLAGAPTDNARLSFIGGNDAAGNLIDDVNVVFSSVPEVNSFGMAMGLGLLALGTIGRVRRRVSAIA